MKMEQRSQMWEIRNESLDTDALDVYIYSSISSYNYYHDEDKENSARGLRDKIDGFSGSRINVYINSYGGSVSEGIAIMNILNRCKDRNIETVAYIDGFACSIASVIPMGCDRVVMNDSSMMMIHNAWTYCDGNAEQLRKIADELSKCDEIIRRTYLKKSNGKITEDKLKELMSAETYLLAEEAYEYGLVDEVTAKVPDVEKVKDQIKVARSEGLEKLASGMEKMIAFARKPPSPSKAEKKTVERSPMSAEKFMEIFLDQKGRS